MQNAYEQPVNELNGIEAFSVGKTIRRLMKESNLTEADLCRGVNLPQTTINRLLSCQTNDPRISTIAAIANFFCVSIEQLLGTEPLHNGDVGKVKSKSVPIISWDKIVPWLENIGNESHSEVLQSQSGWLKTEKPMSDKSFAVWSRTSIEKFFKKDTLLLIDTTNVDDVNVLQDGTFVLVMIDSYFPTIRQTIKEGRDLLLKKLFSPYEVEAYSSSMEVRGTVVEARQQLS